MSTYSSDLKLELIATGDASGTWGDDTNNNLNLIQQAIAGYEAITLSSGSTLALAMTNKSISTARNMVIKFATASIAASTICTIPDSIEKFYIFDCSGLTNPGNLTIKTVSGTGFTPDAAKIYAAYSDGTNITEISLDTLGGTIGSAQIADDAVTSGKIIANAVTTVKILDANVTTAKLAANAVTTAKITDAAVSADKLANTAVTAGSYTLASVTVDGQGRLTAASTGAAGGAEGYSITEFRTGSQSFNYSATDTNATKASGIISGGGGGGGRSNQGAGARPGGHGFFGVYAIDVSPGTLEGTAVQVGTGGSGGASGVAGQAGGTSNFGNVVNAGGGGGGAYPHTPGSPRASVGTTNTSGIFNYSTTDFSPSTTNVAPPSPGTGGNDSNNSNSVGRKFLSIGGQGTGTPASSSAGGDGYIYIFEQIT